MVPPPSTPRKHKNTDTKLPGIRPAHASVERLSDIITDRLKLPFKPEVWQATLIHHIASGYDSIFCAGTGYGKSLIFEGLAAFEKSKTFVVISPLKVLEMDQVREATAKGLKAVAINEDTMRDTTQDVWKRLRQEKQNLIYVSPELAIGAGSPMLPLWKDSTFAKNLGAIFVDEGHCIDEWGESFREEYRKLKQLRTFTGFEIPIVACSATMPTSTFDVIWESLQFGYRPFWGLDVGTTRSNLFYEIRTISNQKDLLLHILNILPASVTSETSRDAIPKTLIYLSTPDSCAQLVRDIRKCLPPHLRNTVRHFSAGISQEGKKLMWEQYMAGEIRILVSTEATALGCNDKFIEYCFVVLAGNDPRSLSVLVQRWGRTGRARELLGHCFFFVPPWAVRPSAIEDPQMARVRGKPKLPETKAATARRAKLHEPLEKLVNIKHDASEKTQLDLYTSLEHGANTPPESRGRRSLARPAISLMWTVLNLQKLPPHHRCCYLCNPEYSATLVPVAPKNDPRLSAFANNFILPLAQLSIREPSPALSLKSTSAVSTQHTASSRQGNRKSILIPKDTRDSLHASLESWRIEIYQVKGSPSMMTPKMMFPDRLVSKLVESAADFISPPVIDRTLIKMHINWGLATDEALDSLAGVITKWREASGISLDVPPSGRGNRKKTRISDTVNEEEHEDVFNPTGLLWKPNPNTPFVLPQNPISRVGAPADHRSTFPIASPSTSSSQGSVMQQPYTPYYVPAYGPHSQNPYLSPQEYPTQGPGAWTPQTPAHSLPNLRYSTPTRTYVEYPYGGYITPQTPISHAGPSSTQHAYLTQRPNGPRPGYTLVHPGTYHAGYPPPQTYPRNVNNSGSPTPQSSQMRSQSPHPLSQSHIPR